MSEWREQVLDDVIELQRGHDLPATTRGEGRVPVIGSFGVTGYHDVAKYPGPGVAIGRSGASIGVATYCPSPYWPLNTCLFVKNFRGNDPRWVYYLLDSIDFSGFNSGSAQPSLNRNYVKGIPVATPPIAEQRAIAGVLGALDDKIESNRRKASLVQQVLRAEMECLAREEDRVVSIGSLVATQSEKLSNPPDDFPYVGLEHMPNFDVVLWNHGRASDSKSASRLANRGAILFGRIRPYFGKVGIAPRQSVVAQSIVVLEARSPHHAAWLLMVLSSRPFIDRVDSLCTGTTMPQVRWEAVAQLAVPVPDEQRLYAFDLWAKPMVEILMGLAVESEKLQSVRDALLPELLSGRLRVREAEEMVGSV